MPAAVAIVAYRCEVAGQTNGSLDIQVRYFDRFEPDAIEQRLVSESPTTYSNDTGSTVIWHLAAILAIEPIETPRDGSEIAGVIFGVEEVSKWIRA